MLYTHAAAAIAGAVIAGAVAWNVNGWRYEAKEAERLQHVAEQARKNERTADKGAAGHEADKARIRTEFITITEEVERVVQKPVYRDVCLDDDGLRILAGAITGQPAAGQSAPAVPRSEPAR